MCIFDNTWTISSKTTSFLCLQYLGAFSTISALIFMSFMFLSQSIHSWKLFWIKISDILGFMISLRFHNWLQRTYCFSETGQTRKQSLQNSIERGYIPPLSWRWIQLYVTLNSGESRPQRLGRNWALNENITCNRLYVRF